MKATVLAAAVLLLAGLVRVETQNVPTPTARAASSEKALIDRYCATCHNERTRAGNLAFETLDVTAVVVTRRRGKKSSARSARG